MPQLVGLYIRNVAIGFAIAAVFCVGLMVFDVAGLGHLILNSPDGWIAALMLFVCNGVVFASVQFAIAVMLMADDSGPRGGLRATAHLAELVPVRVRASRQSSRR